MLLNILLAIHILVCISLIGVILLQRSEGGAFGMGGGGGGGGFMSARGAGDLLTRTTAVLATIFFVLSLTLTLMEGRASGGSITDKLDINASDITAPPPTPGAPTAPLPTVGGAPLPAAPQNSAPLAPATGTQPADPFANLGGQAPQPANR